MGGLLTFKHIASRMIGLRRADFYRWRNDAGFEYGFLEALKLTETSLHSPPPIQLVNNPEVRFMDFLDVLYAAREERIWFDPWGEGPWAMSEVLDGGDRSSFHLMGNEYIYFHDLYPVFRRMQSTCR